MIFYVFRKNEYFCLSEKIFMRTLILYFAALLLLVCCDAPKSKMRARLEYIDSLTYRENYGLADKTLDSINEGELSDDEDKALYYLLRLQTDFTIREESDFDSLIDFSIAYYKRAGTYDKLARSYYYKGVTLFYEGKFNDALYLVKEAESAEKKANIPWLRYFIYSNMSYINSELGAKNIAFEYAFKALEHACGNDNPKWVCAAYNDIATSYYNIGKKDSTFFYYNKMIPLFDKLGPNDCANYLSNIAFLYYEEGDYLKSESLCRQAVALSSAPYIEINLGNACYMLGKTAEGDSLLNSAWPNTTVEDKVEILLFRAEAAERKGDMTLAARYYKEAKAMQDSLQRSRKTEETVAVQRDYERDKYKEGVWRNVLLAFCVVVLLVLSLTLYYRKRINKAKRTISEGNRLIAEYTVRISELEKQDASHAGKVNDLKRKIRNLKDGQAAVLGNGLRLYDEIAAGGTTATWSKKEFDEFIEYYRVGHAEAVAYAENGYRRLSSSNIFYLLLLDMGRDDADVQRTMCMTPGAQRTMKSRINAKKVV